MIGPDDVIDTAVPADEKFMRATDDGKRAEKKMSTDTDTTTARPKLAGAKAPKVAKKTAPTPKAAKKTAPKPQRVARRKFTPKGKAKGDARRVAGKWPGAIGISLEPKLFARLERARSMVAKREKLKKPLGRSKAVGRALDLWLKKLGA